MAPGSEQIRRRRRGARGTAWTVAALMEIGVFPVFDPQPVRDRATYERPMTPSQGIEHVVVGGAFVVRDARPVDGAAPGKPIRRE